MLATSALIVLFCLAGEAAAGAEEAAWQEAERRGVIYADCGRHARQILHGWIEHKQDPETYLFSRGGRWDYANEAADHYSSLVLMARFVEPELIEPGGKLHRTLVSSIRLCTGPSGLPGPYDLRTGTRGEPNVGAVAEWLRDGLLRITEVLGTENDWHREMRRLCDALVEEAEARGGMARLAAGPEARGNLLQTLSRLAAVSGDERYLRAAEELADEYLLGDPIAAVGRVPFGDHGCELVPGLAELFVVERRLGRPRAEPYRRALEKLLDRMVAVGRHPETGLWYPAADLRTGKAQPGLPPDTWGYVLFALENYDRATGGERYRAAVEKPMRWLVENRPRYDELRETLWHRTGNIDDFSDSYESMIVLWNRYRGVPGVFAWLDWITHRGGHRRDRPDSPFGPGNGGHFDGSTGRTLCLHMMLASAGVRAVPFQEGLRLGAVVRDGELLLRVASEAGYRGRLCFDSPRTPRAATPIDWARINEMPGWYVVEPGSRYQLRLDAAAAQQVDGRQLAEGWPIELPPGGATKVVVRPSDPAAPGL